MNYLPRITKRPLLLRIFTNRSTFARRTITANTITRFRTSLTYCNGLNTQSRSLAYTARTMSKNEPCEACKTQPPVVGSGYKEKGVYETIADHKCYVVHPSPTPSKGVLVVYDIFGYFPQTLQGADHIALTEPGNVVVMPDFFHGMPMDIKNYPPDTDEKKKKLGAFFQGPAQPPKTLEAIQKIMPQLKEKYPSVEKWGVLGLCWGGKVATLISGKTDLFAASAQVHPAMLDVADLEDLKVPHLMLASKDEDEKIVKQYCEILAKKNNKSRGDGETYAQDIHGWMGARGNLKNKKEAESFERGYKDIINFFNETLQVPKEPQQA